MPFGVATIDKEPICRRHIDRQRQIGVLSNINVWKWNSLPEYLIDTTLSNVFRRFKPSTCLHVKLLRPDLFSALDYVPAAGAYTKFLIGGEGNLAPGQT